MAARLECDVAVIGAGVAGLWAWRRLRARGMDALLISAGPVGAGQTLASQGIIHGGVKYALTGSAQRASAMIAQMPGVWRACLRGEPAAGTGDPDLSGVRALAQEQYLWTTRGIVSRLGGVAASKALRTDVARVPVGERPPEFRDAPADIDLYRVEEPVIEPASLVRALGGSGEGILVCRAARILVGTAQEPGAGVSCELSDGAACEIRAHRVVCAAGAGNEALLTAVRETGAGTTVPSVRSGLRSSRDDDGSPGAWTQRRPLHMVMVRGEMPLIYGHCVTTSALPRATITSQRDAQGRVVWWVGGAIAESGVERTREAQIGHAKAELREAVPWVNLDRGQWATTRIDRAEGLPEGRAPGARPDEPVTRTIGNVVFAWPTKLAFAPMLATMVERELEKIQRPAARDRGSSPGSVALSGMETPPTIGALPWEDAGVAWS